MFDWVVVPLANTRKMACSVIQIQKRSEDLGIYCSPTHYQHNCSTELKKKRLIHKLKVRNNKILSKIDLILKKKKKVKMIGTLL